MNDIEMIQGLSIVHCRYSHRLTEDWKARRYTLSGPSYDLGHCEPFDRSSQDFQAIFTGDLRKKVKFRLCSLSRFSYHSRKLRRQEYSILRVRRRAGLAILEMNRYDLNAGALRLPSPHLIWIVV